MALAAVFVVALSSLAASSVAMQLNGQREALRGEGAQQELTRPALQRRGRTEPPGATTTLTHSNPNYVLVTRVLSQGVTAFNDYSKFQYTYVPESMEGATLFAPTLFNFPGGTLTLAAVEEGTVYIWARRDKELGFTDLSGWASFGDELRFNWTGGERTNDAWYRTITAGEIITWPVTGEIEGNWFGGVAFKAAPSAAPTPSSPPAAPSSSGDPHVSDLRGQKFDILAPGDVVYLNIPRAAGPGSGALLLRIVAKVGAPGQLCQEGPLFVTALELSGQWLLPGSSNNSSTAAAAPPPLSAAAPRAAGRSWGRVRSLSLSTEVEAKMEAQALKVRLLQEQSQVAVQEEARESSPPAPAAADGTYGSGSVGGGGGVVTRDLKASELAAEFGPSTGLLEVIDYKPKALPPSVNKHTTVLLLKFKLGPTIAKVRMVQEREKDGDDEAAKKEEEEKREGKEKEKEKKKEKEKQQANSVTTTKSNKKRPRFSSSLWLTVTGLEKVKNESIGGILGFDDHAAASQRPQECKQSDNPIERAARSAAAGKIHAVAALGHGDMDDADEES